MTRCSMVYDTLLACLALLCLPASARLSVDEAREVAERYAGHSLASARVHDAGAVVGFYDTRPDGQRTSYSVYTDTGEFRGWTRLNLPTPERPEEPLDPAWAIEIAQATVREVLGPEVGDLEWEALDQVRYVSLEGRSPAIGDPPRYGLGPDLRITVNADGVVTDYEQTLPDTRELLPVALTEAQALRKASLVLGVPSPSIRESELRQTAGRVLWLLDIQGTEDGEPAGPVHAVAVDGRSGEIVFADIRATDTRGSGSGGSVQPLVRYGLYKLRWVVLGIVALCAAVSAIRRGRSRRRAGRPTRAPSA